MIRAGLLALGLAGPAGAEGLGGQALCAAAWEKGSGQIGALGTVTTQGLAQDGDWCVVERPVVDIDGQYVPDWRMDRLRFRGSALGWIATGTGLPEGFEVSVEGLRLVVQTGNAQMDWLFAAQARPNGIDAEAAFAWDPDARVLRLERLSVDFPGENLVEASARLTGVDLSSDAAIEKTFTGFALTKAELNVTTHGLFEWYALMTLGPVMLPPEGDMEAAAQGIRADLVALVGDLPGTSVSQASKAALVALIGELPNPSGDLSVALRADPGLGPERLADQVATGLPDTLADAAPVLQGVTVDVGWSHVDAP